MDGYALNEGKWWQIYWKIHWELLKLHQTCTQSRDRCWWNHCHSLGSLDILTSFLQGRAKKGQWTCHYIPVVLIVTG